MKQFALDTLASNQEATYYLKPSRYFMFQSLRDYNSHSVSFPLFFSTLPMSNQVFLLRRNSA